MTSSPPLHPDAQDLAEWLDRSATIPILGLILSRGPVLTPTSPLEILRPENLRERTNPELAEQLYRSAQLDARALRASSAYFVWIVRGPTDPVNERRGFTIEVAGRSEGDERNSLLSCAREQTEQMSRGYLEACRALAAKNQTELDRLQNAVAQADARALEATSLYFQGVNSYAAAMLQTDERAQKAAIERRSALMLQSAIGMGDIILPALAAGVLRSHGIGSDPAGSPVMKHIATLRGIDAARFAKITSILNPMAVAGLGQAVQGDVSAELLPVAIGRSMLHVPEDVAQQVLEILGPPVTNADGSISPNEAQEAFKQLYALRMHTLQGQADLVLKKVG